MNSSSPHRILVAPLDWGMGHATRCIPLIRKLQQQGAEVLVAVPKTLETRLRQSLSNVQYIPLKGYEIRYHQGIPVWLSVLVQRFKIRRAIRDEHRWIMDHAESLKLDQIVSDNRYGLWHPTIHSVLISHQLQPIAPFGGRLAQKMMQRIMRKLLRNFDEIQVPDFEGANRLSGKLSMPFAGLPPVKFIGPLSRFERAAKEETVPNTLLAILSGPEPHYSRFYHRMKEKAKSEGFVFHALGWKLPEQANRDDMILNPGDEQFAMEVARAEKIVCVAGYSTLCDLLALGREAVLFPTAGQTEQEYIALRHTILLSVNSSTQ